MTICQFNQTDCQCLQKFLHEDWLPLRGSKHMQCPKADTSCPVCQQMTEDLWHFLKRSHPTHKCLLQQLQQQQLKSLHYDNNIDPHLFQLLWQGIHSVHTQTVLDEQYVTYPESIKPLFDDQCQIGWDQLFYGRFAMSWAYYVDHHSGYQVNGTIFYSCIIQHIWTYILKFWTTRNSALHNPTDTHPMVQVLAPQVQLIFDTIEREPALQDHAPYLNLDQILTQPIRVIRSFIDMSDRHIRNHMQSVCVQTILHTQDIHTYLTSFDCKNDHKPP